MDGIEPERRSAADADDAPARSASNGRAPRAKQRARALLAAYVWGVLIVHHRWTFCAFCLAIWLDLVVHEAGHAFVARLFGHAVLDVYLGGGRPARTFRIGLCDVHVAPWPLFGMVRWAPRRRRLSAMEAFLVTGAGPLASASLAGAAFLYTTAVIWRHASLSPFVGTFLCTVTVTSALSCVTNLLSTKGSVPNDGYSSDGSKLLHIVRHGVKEHVPARCVAGMRRGLRLCERGTMRRGSRLILRSARDETVRKTPLLMAALGTVLSHHDCVEEARAIYRQILDDPSIAPRGSAARRGAANGLAYLALYHDRPDLLLEAKAVITAAVDESSDAVTLRVTMGGVLCELGDLDAAETTLADALARSTRPLDQATASAYLAVIKVRTGNPDAATEYARKAQAAGAEHRLVRRLLDAVSSHAASAAAKDIVIATEKERPCPEDVWPRRVAAGG